MRAFNYKAKKPSGEIVKGTLNAQAEIDAVNELRSQGLIVISVSSGKGGARSGAKGGAAKQSGGKQSFWPFGLTSSEPRIKVKTQEMVVFSRQLSTMVGSGIPLIESVEILAEQMTNAGFKKTLDDVAGSVRAGKDMSQALSAHPKVFSELYVNMVRAGEASGQLDVVLTRLAEYQEASAALKAEIKSAMTYPVVSLFLVFGITIFLLVFIIPKFEEMFYSMNVELPAITKGLLATSLYLKSNFLYFSVGTMLVVGLLAYFFKTEKGQFFADWLMLKMPIFGPLFSKVAISRFSRTFSTLIQSGVPILGSLEIVSSTSGNKIISRAIDHASDKVRQGETLGEPLAESKVFPLMVTRMISVGEKTGALESLLEKISEFYDQQVKVTVEGMTSLIEPLMISVMGFLVGGMVMALFLPIFKMVGSLGN